MNEQHTQIVVYRETPGIVAALYDGRVSDAWHLMDASEIDPRLIVVDVWKYLHLGWESIHRANDLTLDPADVRDFWVTAAQESQTRIWPRPSDD